MKPISLMVAWIILVMASPGCHQDENLHRAQVLYDQGQYKASIRLLDTLCSIEPRNHTALKYLMLSHQKLGQYDLAYIYADSAISCGDHSFDAFVNAGDLAYKLDKREQAFNTLMIAYRMDSAGRMVNYDLGILLWLKFDGVTQGLYYMKREAALYPDNTDALSAIGQMYLNIDSIDSSMFYFNKAVKAAPDNYLYYYLRGLAWASQSDWRNAVKDFSSSLALKPDFSDGLYYRAIGYLQLGKKDDACNDLSNPKLSGTYEQADSLIRVYCTR